MATQFGRVDLADLRGATHTGFTASEAAALLRGESIAPERVQRPAATVALPGLGVLADLTTFAPRLRRRIDVAFIACRAWRAESRAAAIVAMKDQKREPSPGFVDAVAAEIAGVVLTIFGAGAFDAVASVACGHSRTPECMGKQLAAAVAERIGAPYRKLFNDRFVGGVSHPKEFRNLPALTWLAEPAGRTLLVDDIATSGWHLKEALDLIRSQGCAASALAWIGGELRGDADGGT